MAQNYYDILGVHRDASTDEIKKAFKKAALTHHPDKGGDPEKFKEIGAAQETLTDESKRAAYDSSLLRLRSRDGLGLRTGSHSAAPAPRAAQPPAAERQQTSSSRPPPARPPRPPGAVEIPADPSTLSVKELKELLSALGIDHENCLEKADLLALVQKRKERKAADPGNGESTPRAGAGASRPAAASRSGSKDGPAQGAAAGPTVKPSEMKEPRALRVKVMSLGSAAVGKSTLIKRYCEGRFVQKYICTIGIDYGVKPVKVNGQDIKVNFFDTSGGSEFKDIRTEFYEQGETRGFLLVYDVTNKKSFTELDDWLDEARTHKCPLSKAHRSGDLPFVVLCANKADLPKRTVTAAEGQAFAARHGMFYYETSAATGESVVEAMNFLFDQIVQRHNHDRKRLGAG